jgi:hypothetical protein
VRGVAATSTRCHRRVPSAATARAPTGKLRIDHAASRPPHPSTSSLAPHPSRRCSTSSLEPSPPQARRRRSLSLSSPAISSRRPVGRYPWRPGNPTLVRSATPIVAAAQRHGPVVASPAPSAPPSGSTNEPGTSNGAGRSSCGQRPRHGDVPSGAAKALWLRRHRAVDDPDWRTRYDWADRWDVPDSNALQRLATDLLADALDHDRNAPLRSWNQAPHVPATSPATSCTADFATPPGACRAARSWTGSTSTATSNPSRDEKGYDRTARLIVRRASLVHPR